MTTNLRSRWTELHHGAALAASLVHVARQSTINDLAATLRNLSRDQLEASCLAMALIHAQQDGPNLDDE